MFAFAGFRKLFHSKFDLTISSFVHYTIQLLYASPEGLHATISQKN